MTLDPLPFDEPDEDLETCLVCAGDWLTCGCDPDEAYPEDAA